MNRKMQVLLASAGAMAGILTVYELTKKRIHTLPYGYGIKMKKAVTIAVPPEKLYGYWRSLDHLPKLFNNVLSAEPIDHSRSHWILRVPGGVSLEWDAEITVDRKNE